MLIFWGMPMAATAAVKLFRTVMPVTFIRSWMVADDGGDAHTAHAGDDIPAGAESPGDRCRHRCAPPDEQQHKEVEAGHAVGQESGQPCAGGPIPRPQGMM